MAVDSGIMKSSATPDEIPIRITEDEPLQLHTNDTPPSMFEDGNSLQDMAANEIGNENDHLLSNSIQSKSNSSWSFRALQPSPRMLVLGHKFKGELVVLLSCTLYSVQNLSSKVVERDVPSMEVVMVRSLVSGTVTVITIICKLQNDARTSGSAPKWGSFFGQRKHYPLLLLRALLGATAFSLAYTAFPYLEIGDHTAIFYLHPVFTMLLSWPVLQEKVGAVEMGMSLVGGLGTVFIVRPPILMNNLPFTLPAPTHSHDRYTTQGPMWVGYAMQIAAAFLASAALMTVRRIGKRETALTMLLWFHVFSVLSGAMVLISGLQKVVIPTLIDTVLLLFIAATSFWGQLSLTWSYQLLPASYAAGLSYLQVVFGYALGVFALNEPLDFCSTLGAGLISCAGISSTIAKAHRDRKPAVLASSMSSVALHAMPATSGKSMGCELHRFDTPLPAIEEVVEVESPVSDELSCEETGLCIQRHSLDHANDVRLTSSGSL